MIKVTLFCSASSGEDDCTFGVGGRIHSVYERMLGEKIGFAAFGGCIEGYEIEKFFAACKNSEVVILDIWNCGSKENMANIAEKIQKINPSAILFAVLQEGRFRVAVHQYAKGVENWDSQELKGALLYAKTNQKRRENMRKILVVDDNYTNLAAAEEQLGENNSLTTVSTFSEAAKMLCKKKWDVVMTDVFMPGESDGLGPEGKKHVGELIPVGLVVALMALKNNIPEIYIVSDTNHHDHPMSWAMDEIKNSSYEKPDGRIKCLCFFTESNCERVKDWKKVLEFQGDE